MVKSSYDRIMPKLLPSHVAMAIDQLFGSNRSELNADSEGSRPGVLI